MKAVFKKSLLLVALLTVIFTSTLGSFAAIVDVNGSDQNLNIENRVGRAFIGSDSIQSFGFTTEIKSQAIIIKNKDVTFTFYRDSNKVLVNDAEMTLDSKTYVKNGVAYVPMKFFFETLNYRVGWTERTKKVSLYKLGEDKFPVVISDGSVNYKFNKPASRVVSLAPSVTEILFAIGAGDLVVGRTEYCDFPQNAKRVKSVGTLKTPDLEGILNLSPDVVIAATHMNEDVLKTLGRAKIQTLTQKSPSKINEIYTFIMKLGILVDHQYESRALVSSLKLKEERVKQAVATLSSSQKKTLYYVVGTGKKESTAGKGTFINEVLQTAGAINVATDVEGWTYTLEKLIEHNPTYLFGESFSYDTMKESPNYRGLSAIQNNRFIVIDGSVFSRPGPRIIDQGFKEIIRVLYPELLKQLQF